MKTRVVLSVLIVCALVVLITVLVSDDLPGCYDIHGVILCGEHSPWYPAA